MGVEVETTLRGDNPSRCHPELHVRVSDIWAETPKHQKAKEAPITT